MPLVEKRRSRNTSGDQRDGLSEFERRKQRHTSGESTISTDSVSNYIPTPPDGGYGWVIVFASFMNHVIVDGIAFTFGIFYGEFLEYFEGGKGETALVGALLSGFYLLTAPVAGSLVNRFGCRVVSISGSLIAFTGFSLSIFSTSIKILSVTYGAIGGFGLGLLYLPNIVAVSYYFHRRRALATGIAVCGAGVGCFIFAPVGQWLLKVYDWKNAMLIVAGVTLHGCVFGALLRSLEPISHSKRPRAKNVFDRLREGIESKTRKRKISENTPVQREIIEKVQVIKEAREHALHEEEAEQSILPPQERVDSKPVMNSLPILVHQTSNESNNELDSDSGVRLSLIVSDMTAEGTEDAPNNSLQTKTASSDSDCSAVKGNKEPDGSPKLSNGIRANGDSCHDSENFPEDKSQQMRLLLASSARVRFSGIGNKSVSYDRLAPLVPYHCTKLPRGVHREDLTRPLYRTDIFYSGSFLNIPEFRSQPNINRHIKSLTMIPDTVPKEADAYICRCIPVSKAVKDTLKQMTDISLLREPVFLIPCLANLFGAIGLFIPFVYSTDRAISLGTDPTQAAFLLSVIGITNTLGRILAGFLADLKHVSPLLLHNLALVAGGVACILNMFCVNYTLMCCFAAFFGLCVATWISLTSIVLCSLLGLERLTNAFGLLTMTRGVATLIGSPIAGLVFDATQDYNASFHVGGSMLLVGGLLCCLLHLPAFQPHDLPMPDDNFAALDMDDTAIPDKLATKECRNGSVC